jgi:ABC-type nitrate/sulfonate/bicarbonate transport system substrate-binding protein
MTRQFAKNQGLLKKLEARKVTDCENVMILAQALATNSVDAAVIWDCTATQVNAQNPDSIRVAGYLDPINRNYGLVQFAQTELASPATTTFEQFIRSNIDQIKAEFSISGFSKMANAPSEQID